MDYYTLYENRDSICLEKINGNDLYEYNESNTAPALWAKMLVLINEYQRLLFKDEFNKEKAILAAKRIIESIAPTLKGSSKIKFYARERPSFEAVIKNGTVSFNMFE